MGRSRGFRQGRTIGVRRRLTSWEEGPGDTPVNNITATGSIFLGQALTPTVDGLTLVRLRGRLSAVMTGTSSIAGGVTGAFGIGVATLAAVTAGITSVPTPITEQAWDGWLYWMPFQLHTVTATIGDAVNAAVVRMDWEIDSKAMRKLKEEDAIYAVIETSVELGSSNTQVFFDSRILLKLP